MDEMESRVNYYLNNLKSQEHVDVIFKDIQTSNSRFPSDTIKAITLMDINNLCYRQRDNFLAYGNDFVNIMRKDKLWFQKYLHTKVLFKWGDAHHDHENKDAYHLAKTRLIDSINGVILPLDYNYHWSPVNTVKDNDIPFDNKKNILLWRGTTTGAHLYEQKRLNAVEKMFNNTLCDVGFASVCQGQNPVHLLKNKMKQSEMLQYKYLLALEGNDVASSLKWQLYSNSVVFMKKPTVISWAMEDTLKPFVHYVPLKDDFSDFEEKIVWANNNQDKCKEISRESTLFIEQFMNPVKEDLIKTTVLKKYLEKMNIQSSLQFSDKTN